MPKTPESSPTSSDEVVVKMPPMGAMLALRAILFVTMLHASQMKAREVFVSLHDGTGGVWTVGEFDHDCKTAIRVTHERNNASATMGRFEMLRFESELSEIHRTYQYHLRDGSDEEAIAYWRSKRDEANVELGRLRTLAESAERDVYEFLPGTKYRIEVEVTPHAL